MKPTNTYEAADKMYTSWWSLLAD